MTRDPPEADAALVTRSCPRLAGLGAGGMISAHLVSVHCGGA